MPRTNALLLLAIFFTYKLVANVSCLAINFTGLSYGQWRQFDKRADDNEDDNDDNGEPSPAKDGQKFWITKVEPIDEDLLAVQALVVKDEEVPATDCKAKKDLRYSDKRYLMCAGSILSNRFILTSASCVHEATYIRHNIRAQLSVIVAPFSDTSQVIKVLDYQVHPEHKVDPRDDNHALHNVAVMKLGCKITKNNLKVIKLPTEPIGDTCQDDNCIVTIIKRTDMVSYEMYQINAKNTMSPRDKRDKTDKTENLNQTANKVAFNIDETEKVLLVDKNEFTTEVFEILEKVNNESSSNIDEKSSGIVRSIQNKMEDIHSFPMNSVINNDRSIKKLSIRSSDGLKGCAQTGAAVMSSATQAGLVAVSCDDRQPATSWLYTDLFDNRDWINQVLGKSDDFQKIKSLPMETCSTCIYNYFIDYGCKNKGNCNKDLPTTITRTDELNIPGIETPKCSKNDTKPAVKSHLSTDFNDAIRALYKNYQFEDEDIRTNDLPVHNDEENSSLTDPVVRISVANYNKYNSRNPEENRWKTSDYSGEYYTNYREVKAIDLKHFKLQENIEPKDFKDDKKLDLELLINNNKNDKSIVPEEYAFLYKKFLDENPQFQYKPL